MDVERLINKLFGATYMWRGTAGSSYRDTAIHDDEAARGAIKEAVYEWASEEITALEAENKTLRIKLENAEDVLRGLKEDLADARAELRERW